MIYEGNIGGWSSKYNKSADRIAIWHQLPKLSDILTKTVLLTFNP